MTGPLLPLLVAMPLVVAAALVLIPRHTRVNLAVLMGVLAVTLAGGIGLIYLTRDGDTFAHGVSLWPAGIAIPLAADMLAALMVTTTALLTLTCAAFAVSSGFAQRLYFAPLVLILVAGINGALLTADLFNLFVFIEVMLLPSYALFILAEPGKGRFRRIKGARLYVLINLLTSTVFLTGVAFVYGVAGTVNFAELAGAARESDVVAAAVAVCLFALSIKAAVVPVHGWLARTYPATSPAVTALFSGLHTKVAIYAMYRIYSVIFEGDSRFLWIGVVAFSLTMVVGVLGAVGENSMRSILVFHMVSQIGYILLGVALFGLAGLTAGIFYLIHHMIVKASLFLSTGAIEVRYGTGKLHQLGGLARREPWVAAAFFAAALSLAGIPPFSGFVAKLSLLIAAASVGQIVAVVVMILVSLVTLMSMLKIWSGVFWGKASDSFAAHAQASSVVSVDEDVNVSGSSAVLLAKHVEHGSATDRRIGPALMAPALVLAVITLGLGLGSELLLSLAETAAQGLLDPSGYVLAVMGE